MSIFQSITNFGRKALLVGGLVAVLGGCSYDTDIPRYKTTQIFRDLNGDGKPEIITLKFNGYTDKQHSYLIKRDYIKNDHADYSLMVSKGNGDGTFTVPIESRVFHGKPEGMH